tara:strand:+ start:60 stop:182 length:123 start_codon:yes stop_codon:yes gene_type:complete
MKIFLVSLLLILISPFSFTDWGDAYFFLNEGPDTKEGLTE